MIPSWLNWLLIFLLFAFLAVSVYNAYYYYYLYKNIPKEIDNNFLTLCVINSLLATLSLILLALLLYYFFSTPKETPILPKINQLTQEKVEETSSITNLFIPPSFLEQNISTNMVTDDYIHSSIPSCGIKFSSLIN